MSEMLKTIEPKSDQLNADDLIGDRTMTIKITSVSIVTGDQPVVIHYEGDNGKPYKACKSMRRVLVHAWGFDRNAYVGQRMTLYRDDRVTFGGVAVGGIRISHMSGIDKELTVALTASRAVRKPYTVKPLEATAMERDCLAAGNEASERGMRALEDFWKGLTPAERQAVGSAQLESWKRTASEASL